MIDYKPLFEVLESSYEAGIGFWRGGSFIHHTVDDGVFIFLDGAVIFRLPQQVSFGTFNAALLPKLSKDHIEQLKPMMFPSRRGAKALAETDFLWHYYIRPFRTAEGKLIFLDKRYIDLFERVYDQSSITLYSHSDHKVISVFRRLDDAYEHVGSIAPTQPRHGDLLDRDLRAITEAMNSGKVDYHKPLVTETAEAER